MILRRPLLHLRTALQTTTPKPILPLPIITQQQTRPIHHRIPLRPIPQPTPFIPDAPTFLKAIGRGLSAHASKIPSWDALFTLSSSQLKDLGIEPARTRRYLLHWREKFRNGEFGVGGDCRFVQDGVAELRVVDVPVYGNAGGEGGGIALRAPVGRRRRYLCTQANGACHEGLRLIRHPRGSGDPARQSAKGRREAALFLLGDWRGPAGIGRKPPYVADMSSCA